MPVLHGRRSDAEDNGERKPDRRKVVHAEARRAGFGGFARQPRQPPEPPPASPVRPAAASSTPRPAGNVGKADAMVEESLRRQFHSPRSGTAGAYHQRAAREERDGRKRSRSICSKSSRATLNRSSAPFSASIRSRQTMALAIPASACQGCRAVRSPDNVGVVDHRMDHALRMDDHLDHVRRRARQPVGLDDLQALVHRRRRID